MAKLYGEIAKSALLTLDKSFSRALGQPLDASEVYYSLAAAKAYAATPAAYIGQKIVVIEDGKVYHYSVEDAAGTLKELGVRPIGDGESIDVDENGNISIHGFDALTNEHIGYLPRVKKVVDKEATYKTIEATKDEVATVTLPKKVNTINIPALGLVTDVEVTSIATYRPGSEVPRNLIESDYSVFLDGDKLHITLAQETELDRLAVNYTYTYSTRTIAVPEESHLEIEWAPISAIVEGDTNTITQVVGTIGEESFVTHTHNEATDTHTYTIDLSPVTNRLDVLEGDADKEGSVAYQVAEGVITAKGYVDNLEERLDGTLDPITVKKAEDAEKLGGKAASEYATAEGLNELAQDYAEFNAAVITGTFNGQDFYVGKATQALQDGDGNVIKDTYAKSADLVDYTVTMEENTENTSVAKTYIFKQLNKEIGRINLAKELVVTSGTVKEVVTENVPYQGAKVGEKYIELIIANQAEPLYIPANDLVEYITTEDTATIDLTLDADHKLTAELKDGAVTAGKLEEAVQTKLGYIDVNKNITVAIADAVAIANGYADDLNDDMDARVQVLEGIDHDAYIAADTVLQGVLEGKIATAKGEAISDADGKLDAYKGEVVTTLTNYYNKTEIDGKVGAINTAIEGEAAARGELATEVANDKQALADYKTEMATALGKKVDTGTIAHTSENVEEGVTRNGTSLDIVVDAYKKAETYTRGEVDKAITDKIQAVTGGENASAVKLALSDYIKANDTEIYGATKVAEWTVDGVYTPDYTKESRLDSLKGQADVNARDILALQNTVNGTADNNGEDGLVRRLAKLETEVRTDVDQRLDTAEGAISGLTELTGTHTGQIKTIVETTIPGLQGAINGKVAQGDFDALNNKVDTGDKNVSKYVEDAVKVEENRAKGEEARVEGLVTAEANRAKGEESRIEGLVTAEAGRADLAEKALGKRIDDLTNGAVKDNTDEIAAINAILNTISDTDNITSLKELAIWVEEHETEVIPVVNKNTEDIAALNTKVDTGDKNVSKYVEDAIAAAAYTLPAATVAALGGIKSAADVEGKVVANKVYVDATTNVGEVKAISTDLLVQGDTELILNGGNAALN